MDNSVTREWAIEVLANANLKQLSIDDRFVALTSFPIDDLLDDVRWNSISPEIRAEVDEAEIKDPEHQRFDEVIAIDLALDLEIVSNESLLQQIQQFDQNIQAVEGEPKLIEWVSCPCCGCQTLSARGNFEICTVCWWEDDGQDNEQISIITKVFDGMVGGPNRVGLTAARYNFITHGICEPERSDLKIKAEPAEKYLQGRTFRFDRDTKVISEDGTNWSCDLSAHFR